MVLETPPFQKKQWLGLIKEISRKLVFISYRAVAQENVAARSQKKLSIQVTDGADLLRVYGFGMVERAKGIEPSS